VTDTHRRRDPSAARSARRRAGQLDLERARREAFRDGYRCGWSDSDADLGPHAYAAGYSQAEIDIWPVAHQSGHICERRQQRLLPGAVDHDPESYAAGYASALEDNSRVVQKLRRRVKDLEEEVSL
jgi:hypothetical protein